MTRTKAIFRISIDHKSIRYLTVDHGLYEVDDMYFATSLIPILPSPPSGDWNEGHIKMNVKNDQPHCAKVTKTQLPQIHVSGTRFR